MSAWLMVQIERAGGKDWSDPTEERRGCFRAMYRGYHILLDERAAEVHLARIEGFDRWANSRLYAGPAVYTLEALDAQLDRLDAAMVQRKGRTSS